MHGIVEKMRGKPSPCMFYPAIKKCGFSVEEALRDAVKQAEVLNYIDRNYRFGAVIRMTELWCEGESLGASVTFSDRDFPKVDRAVFDDAEELAKIVVPNVINRTTEPLLEAVKLAAPNMTKPLIVGVTGPYTLGAVLNGSSDFMMNCLSEPDSIHIFLQKITLYLEQYIEEYKKVGADGVMIAEPMVSMISPDMLEEFSNDYIKKLIHKLQDDQFAVIYHNCGPVTPYLASIMSLKAVAFHFGSDVDLEKALALAPADTAIMGNIEPQMFLRRNAGRIREKVGELRERFGADGRLILSTGCDLSPAADEESIEALNIK